MGNQESILSDYANDQYQHSNKLNFTTDNLYNQTIPKTKKAIFNKIINQEAESFKDQYFNEDMSNSSFISFSKSGNSCINTAVSNGSNNEGKYKSLTFSKDCKKKLDSENSFNYKKICNELNNEKNSYEVPRSKENQIFKQQHKGSFNEFLKKKYFNESEKIEEIVKDNRDTCNNLKESNKKTSTLVLNNRIRNSYLDKILYEKNKQFINKTNISSNNNSSGNSNDDVQNNISNSIKNNINSNSQTSETTTTTGKTKSNILSKDALTSSNKIDNIEYIDIEANDEDQINYTANHNSNNTFPSNIITKTYNSKSLFVSKNRSKKALNIRKSSNVSKSHSTPFKVNSVFNTNKKSFYNTPTIRKLSPLDNISSLKANNTIHSFNQTTQEFLDSTMIKSLNQYNNSISKTANKPNKSNNESLPFKTTGSLHSLNKLENISNISPFNSYSNYDNYNNFSNNYDFFNTYNYPKFKMRNNKSSVKYRKKRRRSLNLQSKQITYFKLLENMLILPSDNNTNINNNSFNSVNNELIDHKKFTRNLSSNQFKLKDLMEKLNNNGNNNNISIIDTQSGLGNENDNSNENSVNTSLDNIAFNKNSKDNNIINVINTKNLNINAQENNENYICNYKIDPTVVFPEKASSFIYNNRKSSVDSDCLKNEINKFSLDEPENSAGLIVRINANNKPVRQYIQRRYSCFQVINKPTKLHRDFCFESSIKKRDKKDKNKKEKVKVVNYRKTIASKEKYKKLMTENEKEKLKKLNKSVDNINSYNINNDLSVMSNNSEACNNNINSITNNNIISNNDKIEENSSNSTSLNKSNVLLGSDDVMNTNNIEEINTNSNINSIKTNNSLIEQENGISPTITNISTYTEIANNNDNTTINSITEKCQTNEGIVNKEHIEQENNEVDDHNNINLNTHSSSSDINEENYTENIDSDNINNINGHNKRQPQKSTMTFNSIHDGDSSSFRESIDSFSDNNSEKKLIISSTAEADVTDYFFQKDCKRMLELRRNYVYKLISNKLWTSNKNSSTHNCIIVYDWDDTLFYTSFLGQNNIILDLYVNNVPDNNNSIFRQIESIVYDILIMSLEKGDTYIISNSSKGWVEFSCAKYFPSVVPLLEKIHVISSRFLFETQYPKDYKKWKVEAFKELLKRYNSYLVTNILSIGDSTYEIEAAHVLGGYFREAYVKTIKFKTNPTPKELFKQLTMLKTKFVDVYSLIKNLNMKVEKKDK